MRPRILLCDIGGVILRTPFELIPAFERRLGLPAGTVDIHGPFAPDRDPLWGELLDGAITERDYWRSQAISMARYVGVDGDPYRAFFDVLFDLDERDLVRTDVRALTEDAAARLGLVVAGFTNDLSRFHSSDWVERMTFLKLFDPIVDLSHSSARKPAPAAYAEAIAVLECDPEDVLFVDDQKGNVAGGDRAGFRSVHFDVTAPERAVVEVRSILGLD